MYVVKYIKDNKTPYIMRGLLRVDNVNLAKQFTDVDTATQVAQEYGYNIEDIMIVNI